MHLGIIGSGYDVFMTLGLMNHTNHVFSCIVDSTFGPRSQKSWEMGVERVQKCLEYTTTLGVEKVILPPVYELMFRDNIRVVPLFQTYFLQYVLPKSRIGKLGILSDYYETSIIQGYIQDICTLYPLTEFQAATKKFQDPFVCWTKDVSLRSDFLKRAKPSDWMVRKYIKNDLRYFQDADVDSLIPTSYGHFYREGVLRHHLNFKKIRRQEKKIIQSLGTKLLGLGENYDCRIFANDDISKMIEEYPWKGYIKKDGKLQEVIYRDW